MPGGQIRVAVAGGLVTAHDAPRGSARINYTEVLMCNKNRSE